MSEQYIVSARKYRPQTFDTVVGQEHITTTLKNAIRNQHLAHAYLFCGPRGVGKTTCARILARTINCENPTPDMEACGVCVTCQSFKDNTSFNVFELDAASNNSVDDIRNLTDQVRFAPQQGKYKIYIIDEVHMLSASAFNAFLKTLEEPPPYAIFILATTEKHKILPTILSRCQIFDFKRITTTDIVTHLDGIAKKENINAVEAALHIIAQKSEGCMRDALSMLDRISSFTNGVLTYTSTMEHLNLLDADFYFRLLDHTLSQDVSGTLLQLDSALEKGFEGDVIINGLAEHLRNLLLCKDQRMAKLLDVPGEHKPIYYEKANQTPPSFILSALNVLNDTELNYKTATNKRLHIELCLIRLCYVMQAVSASAVQDDLKKNFSPLVATAPVAIAPTSPAQPVQQAHPIQNTVAAPPVQQPVQQATPQPSNIVAEPARPYTAQPTAAPAPTAPALNSPSAPSAARRVSRNLMGDMQEAFNNAAQTSQVAKMELTLDWANDIFNQYKDQARSQNKLVLVAQLGMMVLEVYPPEEIKIVSTNEMINEYALKERNDMIEFFRKHTDIIIRITTEVRIDKNTDAEPVTTTLSKTEMYQAMVDKNPALGQLKDGLNLQIEY